MPASAAATEAEPVTLYSLALSLKAAHIRTLYSTVYSILYSLKNTESTFCRRLRYRRKECVTSGVVVMVIACL